MLTCVSRHHCLPRQQKNLMRSGHIIERHSGGSTGIPWSRRWSFAAASDRSPLFKPATWTGVALLLSLAKMRWYRDRTRCPLLILLVVKKTVPRPPPSLHRPVKCRLESVVRSIVWRDDGELRKVSFPSHPATWPAASIHSLHSASVPDPFPTHSSLRSVFCRLKFP